MLNRDSKQEECQRAVEGVGDALGDGARQGGLLAFQALWKSGSKLTVAE